MCKPITTIQTHQQHTPRIAASTWLHATAQVIGDVSLNDDCSVWCGAVIRGDVNHIRIGARVNIQDNSVLHVSHKSATDPLGAPLIIGDDVTVGHGVILHGCQIGNGCLIGMGSLVMDKAVVAPHVLIGAGSLVAEGKTLASGYLYLGRPARQIRPLSTEEIDHIYYSAQHYVQLARNYRTSQAGNGLETNQNTQT